MTKKKTAEQSFRSCFKIKPTLSLTSPQFWGNHAWIFLYSVAKSYPTRPTGVNKDTYKMFFLSLPFILPCKTCQDHLRILYNKKYKRKYITQDIFKSRSALVRFVCKLYRDVSLGIAKTRSKTRGKK